MKIVMQVSKSSLQVTAVLIILASFICAALSFLLPVAPTVQNSFMTHTRTAIAVVLGVLYTGSALWFFAGLKNFKTRLRVAFVLLGAGLIMFSIAMLQLPIFGLFDLWQSAWATGGGVIIIFISPTVLMYFAMRQFAQTLTFHDRTSSFGMVLGITTAVTLLCWIAAYYLVQYELAGVDIYIAAVGTVVTLSFFSGYLALKIIDIIGPSYQKAMKWQVAFFFSLALGGMHEIITTFFMTAGDPYQDYGIYLWPFVVSSFIILRASYEFRLLTSMPEEVTSNSLEEPTDRDYIDSIIALAELASRPEETDSILDELRLVTGKLTPDTSLTLVDKTRLIKVYYQLEMYLMKNDPLRTFEKLELRRHITPRFRAILGKDIANI